MPPSELAVLLDMNLEPNEKVRLSFASLASIVIDEKQLLLRNKGAWRKQGRIIYTPIGGAVSVSADLQKEFEQKFSVPGSDWERVPANGSIDMRVMVGREALAGALRWYTALDDSVRSPERELVEELVEEENLCTPEQLVGTTYRHANYFGELKRWQLPGKSSLTFHLYDVWNVNLPEPALDALLAEGSATVLLASADEITRGVWAGTIGSNALALTNCSEELRLPPKLSDFGTV